MNQFQIEYIVNNYEEYKNNNEIDLYLRAISYKMKLYPPDLEEEEQGN